MTLEPGSTAEQCCWKALRLMKGWWAARGSAWKLPFSMGTGTGCGPMAIKGWQGWVKDHSACQTAFRVATKGRTRPERSSRAAPLDSWPKVRDHRSKRPSRQGVETAYSANANRGSPAAPGRAFVLGIMWLSGSPSLPTRKAFHPGH
eukprot:4788384-Lingulodinium_polyedra.AAC.1